MSATEAREKGPVAAVNFSDDTKAIMEVAKSRGFEIGALLLVRRCPSGGSVFEYFVVANGGLPSEMLGAVSVALEEHGFQKVDAPPWTKQ